MRGNTYRLQTSTLAIFTYDDGHKIPIMIPEGAMVEVLGEMNGNRLIDVIWEGKPVLMFTIDLRNRAVPYDPGHAITSG